MEDEEEEQVGKREAGEMQERRRKQEGVKECWRGEGVKPRGRMFEVLGCL